LFAFASVVLTLPLAQHPTRTLPSDLVDTLLTTWVISWDADRLRHGLDGVWNAPIYYPYLRTLAFSENLFGIAFLAAPVYWISGNPVLTYNIAFLFAFTVAGTGMYVLVRELTGSPVAAAVGGMYYAFCPYRTAQAQLSHIQMLATGWLPLALWALHRYFESYRRKWLAVLVAAACLQALSNTYLAYFMAVPMAVVLAFHALRCRDRIRRWSIGLLAAATITVAVLAPIGVQYYRVQIEQQHVRSAGEIETGGADLRAYFVAVSGLWRRWLPLPQGIFGESEKELFPGLVAPCLAALALGGAVLRRRASPAWPLAYALIAVAGFLLSLGPLVRVWGVVLTRHGPYDWLQHVAPGMGGMRTPSRFVVRRATGHRTDRSSPSAGRDRGVAHGRCRRRLGGPHTDGTLSVPWTDGGSRGRRMAGRCACGSRAAPADRDDAVPGVELPVRDAVPSPSARQRLHRVGFAAPAAPAPSAQPAVRLRAVSGDSDDAAFSGRALRRRPSRRLQHHAAD
jgi:hypothetical protein